MDLFNLTVAKLFECPS